MTQENLSGIQKRCREEEGHFPFALDRFRNDQPKRQVEAGKKYNLQASFLAVRCHTSLEYTFSNKQSSDCGSVKTES